MSEYVLTETQASALPLSRQREEGLRVGKMVQVILAVLAGWEESGKHFQQTALVSFNTYSLNAMKRTLHSRSF